MIKYILLFILISTSCFSQEANWITTEGKITEISFKRSGRRPREIATVKFNLENGSELSTITELFRIPILGSMKSVGDSITIKYDKSNPAIIKTNTGKFITDYGMYILIILGIIFSVRPFLKVRKQTYDSKG